MDSQLVDYGVPSECNRYFLMDNKVIKVYKIESVNVMVSFGYSSINFKVKGHLPSGLAREISIETLKRLESSGLVNLWWEWKQVIER